MKQSRFFGTDGIRGVAGQHPLDREAVFAIGRALGYYLRRHEALRVLIGQDTRESSPWIAATLAAGLAEEGVVCLSAGVIPTAGVAYLARTEGFSAGVMISASHNPYQDNGIKVIAHSGYKLPDADEMEVEEAMSRYGGNGGGSPAPPPAEDPTLRARYEDFLCSLLPAGVDFAKLRMVFDCANGAASTVAPGLFRRLGAAVVAISDQPDGRNINLDCGSLHPARLQARVPAEGADLGVAFDGDADRALFVSAQGELIDGDGVLYMAAQHLLAEGNLKNRLVIGTVMANLGLELALDRLGIRLLRTPVGDKYVLEEMLSRGANLGGEQSGHIIFSDDHTTGDGLLTAMRVAEILVSSGRTLAEMVAGLRVFPQVIRNVRVRQKPPVEQLPEVRAAIEASRRHFGAEGRVIVRYSGTEPLARIMVEAADENEVRRHAEAIAEAFQRAIGAETAH
jgi:phosphoglucosamine mutase